MILRYKGYKIVDSKGLKSLMKSAIVSDDYEFRKYLKDNKILFVNKSRKSKEFLLSYETLIKANEQNKGKKKLDSIYIVYVYESVTIVEIRKKKEISVVRKDLDELISEVLESKAYITNIEELKDVKGFIGC